VHALLGCTARHVRVYSSADCNSYDGEALD